MNSRNGPTSRAELLILFICPATLPVREDRKVYIASAAVQLPLPIRKGFSLNLYA